jgi:phosphomannomutase
MADQKKTLGQLVDDLQTEFGPHYYGRRDLRIERAIIEGALQRAAKLERIGQYKVQRSENLDGLKFFLDAKTNGNGAEAWILMRASGTEPLMRLYCEAASPDLVNEILENSVAFVMEKATAA